MTRECEDAISRQAVLSKIKEVCFSEEWVQFRVDNGSSGQRDFLINYIERLQPVTPQQKIGHWILADEQNKEDVENDNYRFICSECQCSDIHAKDTIVPYCWKCGEKMEWEVEE